MSPPLHQLPELLPVHLQHGHVGYEQVDLPSWLSARAAASVWVDAVRTRPFAYPMTYRLLAHSWIPDGVRRLAVKRLGGAPSPFIMASRCNGCETCSRSCPAEAIEMVQKKARIEQKRCISCFCCHELCLQQAVGIKVPRLWRLFRV